MLAVPINFFLVTAAITLQYAVAQNSVKYSFRHEKVLHTADSLDATQVKGLSQLSNTTNLNEILDNICVVRVVGTPAHGRVGKYIKNYMDKLGWSTELDVFEDDTPNFGRLTFKNIIAKLNPNAQRYLALACHYDSKYSREGDFVGATDSAVPCAQMMNLVTVMREHLEPLKQGKLSLMLIFFDGEEAFRTWGPKDSIYGSRHLAAKWQMTRNTIGYESDITDLDKIDLLVLLDLLGAPDPTFYNYFDNTENWYLQLVKAEKELAKLKLFDNYSYDQPEQSYFQPFSIDGGVEDDHIPFLRRNVPILHIIPNPFPTVWHTVKDNRNAINIPTTENLNKIFRLFVASYLKLRPSTRLANHKQLKILHNGRTLIPFDT
ncbi:glutaminyl-peptide cyclotransferase-like isoform X2 [Diachasmimorpha longicaudata]|uniref:glutaminyl-peptide cyclotransferase-like isoform X2 n=1 Tax=Diachasmimorpha longicaudata TaxID=58733 RepID=UPI0030B8FE4A